MKMWRRKKTFLVTLVVCVTVVRVLFLNLPSEEENTYEDIFKSRHLADSGNVKEGTARKLQHGYVKEKHHKRNKAKKDVESNNFRPEDDVQAMNKGPRNQKDSAKDGHHGSNAREDFVSLVTDKISYTTDGEMMVSRSSTNNSYPPTKQIMIQAGLLRVAYVENLYRGSNRYQLQESSNSRRCPCGLGTNRSDVIVTSEEDASNLGDFDILIFVQDTGQKSLTPSIWRDIVLSAKKGQRRVYASIESISKVRYLLPPVPQSNGPFHWSLTYHSKSDMPVPYGHYQPFEYVETDNFDKNWAEGKTGLVAWISSGKSKMWKQDEFVKSLQAYFQVDIFLAQYSSCRRNNDSCREKMKKYKFYLAIEDSCCSEYMTDKLWRSFSWGVVPIVVGAPKEDYLRVAPPNSFIYADDFETPEDLGDHLRKLDNTDEFYNDHFQWRQEGEVFSDWFVRGSSREDAKDPPDTSLYSCRTVCRVAKKYVDEKSSEKEIYTGSYFDPRKSWWGKSCKVCGSHKWISHFC